MKWRKAALWTVGVAVLLFGAAALCLRVLVDPERLKRAAHERAQAAWQRELLLGDVVFHLFPVPSLRAAKVSIANPPWAKNPHLLVADDVRADLELLPLLVGKVRIKRLSLEGVKVELEVADDGSASWELGRRDARAQAPNATAEGDPLQIETVRIRNARIAHGKANAQTEPWLVEEALLEARPGLRDGRIEAKIARHGKMLQVKASFADLSKLGVKGAVSEGKIELDWGGARLAAEGRFPLDRTLAGMDLAAHLEAKAMEDLFAFFGVKRNKIAAVDIKLKARDTDGKIAVTDLAFTLGALKVRGDAKVTLGDTHSIDARLEAEHLDWLKTLADAGGTIRPKRQDGEVFHADPVAWRGVKAIGSLHGAASLTLASFKMGNGLQLANVRTKLTFGDGRMAFSPFAAEMLGGAARGVIALDSGRKSVRFEIDGDNLMLERWLRERGRKVPFTGGPMTVHARLSLAGDTYRDLAASVTGPFTLRMGPGQWEAQRAGEFEEMMVSALQPRDGKAVKIECAAANLEFKSGKASGKDIIGARSDIAQLVTSGHLDYNDETIDLRGNVYARKGIRLGLSAIASDVQITGKVAKPTMRLDPDAAPAVIARAGAAIASAGASLIGGALIDVMESRNDPCIRVFRKAG